MLFKGQKARRLPIIIEPMANLTSPIPTLRVDDQYLVLDSKRTADEYDLSVTGGSMNVEVSRARIRRLDCNLKFGTVHLDHLRHDYAHISIQADDIAVEDNRDYELQYAHSFYPNLCIRNDSAVGCNSKYTVCYI